MNNLKKIRQENKITQKKLSEELNINTRQYQKYELGEQSPSVEIAIEIAKKLDTTVEKIWGEVANMNIRFKELRKKFDDMGYVLSKNNDGSYSSAKDIGDGWTDSNSIVTPFKNLDEAEKWLDKEPMSLEEFDKMMEEKEVLLKNKEGYKAFLNH